MDERSRALNPVTYSTGMADKTSIFAGAKARAFQMFREENVLSGMMNDIFSEELTRAKEYASEVGVEPRDYLIVDPKGWKGPTIYEKTYVYDLERMSEELKRTSIERGDNRYRKSYAEMINSRNEDFARRRSHEESVISRTRSPLVANLMGGAIAMNADPVDVAAMMLTGGTVSAVRKTNALKRALAVGAVTGSAEAVKQTVVWRSKKDIESPYSVREALMNVGTVTLGAGALDFVGSQGTKALTKYLAKENDIILNTAIRETKEGADALKANNELLDDLELTKAIDVAEGKKTGSPVDGLERIDGIMKAVDNDDIPRVVSDSTRFESLEKNLDSAVDTIVDTPAGKIAKEYTDNIDSHVAMYKKMLEECNG